MHSGATVSVLRDRALVLHGSALLRSTETVAPAQFGARWILNTDPDLVLYGRYVVPQRLISEGYVFTFPTLKEAMIDLLK